MKTERILKDLMLGLIYPAVLGTIIYLGLDFAYDQWLGALDAFHSGNHIKLDCVTTVKSLFLLVAILFYLCDYLYIVFTKNYRKMFFLFDLTFLIGLYVSVRVLYLKQTLPLKPHIIAAWYGLFMLLYYVWDHKERTEKTDVREQQLYGMILRWEILSIAGLVLWAIFDLISIRCKIWPRWPEIVLLSILVIITSFFAKYTWAKREFV